MVFNCKMCGANLEIIKNMRICKCAYCGSYQTIPDISTENRLNLFKKAHRLRFGCEFDRAAEAYREIIDIFPEESEAYWGLCLCRYGIEYVDDPKTNKKIPTCHRTDFERIYNIPEYSKALEYADEIMYTIYTREAEKIDDIQQHIISVSAKEKPFDIFICYKETGENGERTEDSFIAHDLYSTLTKEGYKVFYAAVTLKDKLGTEFEPYIFSAINSSQVMLCVGTSTDNFNAVWVRNEWSRFLDLMKEDKSRLIIPCYKNMPVSSLPDELQGFQAQDMEKYDARNNITKSISEIFSVASDTKDQLKSLFAQYEKQMKSQLNKIHRYEQEKHAQLINEKLNAENLYKQEYQSYSTSLILAMFGATVISSILSGLLKKFFDESVIIVFSISWFMVLGIILALLIPQKYKSNKAAKERMFKRLAYDETAADYESGKKNLSQREEAVKKYRKEKFHQTHYLD
ncbi:MAG: TIR domain-containing protein [Ruminococcus sp.]|nr:TIR domain-containing protein [Ruminococcus sp.]